GLGGFVGQRVGQAADHFLRADLPEAAAGVSPVVEHVLRPAGAGLGCVLFDGGFEHGVPVGGGGAQVHHRFVVHAVVEVIEAVVHEGHAAGHACGEVVPHAP